VETIGLIKFDHILGFMKTMIKVLVNHFFTVMEILLGIHVGYTLSINVFSFGEACAAFQITMKIRHVNYWRGLANIVFIFQLLKCGTHVL